MIKILVNRAIPNSEKIKNRQDFDLILKKRNQISSKNILPWYFGVIGLASFIVAIMTILL